MLILTRKLGDSIIIGDNIKVTVVEINKHQIRIGVNAPKKVTIHREEVFNRIKEENTLSSSSRTIDLDSLLKKKQVPTKTL